MLLMFIDFKRVHLMVVPGLSRKYGNKACSIYTEILFYNFEYHCHLETAAYASTLVLLSVTDPDIPSPAKWAHNGCFLNECKA